MRMPKKSFSEIVKIVLTVKRAVQKFKGLVGRGTTLTDAEFEDRRLGTLISLIIRMVPN